LSGTIPLEQASGRYRLEAYGPYTPGNRYLSMARWVEVSGADVIAKVTPGLYVADSEVLVSLVNNGSVDAEVVYELWLRDRDSQVFLGENSGGVMVPAHATVVVTGTIPEGTRSGRYGLHVNGTYTPGERQVRGVQLVEIAGPEIALKGRTDRTLYLTSDNITVTANVTNTGAPLPEGDLELAIVRELPGAQAWEIYNTYNSELAYDTVSAVEVDAGGNVWFASTDGGYGPPELNRLLADLETWEYHYLPEPMGWTSTVFEIVSDSVGQTWFATDAGVGVLSADRTTWTVYQEPDGEVITDGLLSNLVYAMAVDDAGNAWFGTGGGVNLLTSGGQWIDYTPSNSDLLSYQVYAVALDDDGGVWFGTDAGLSHLLPDDTWVNYTPQDSGLLGDEVVDIAIDGAGSLWLAVPGWNWGVSVLLSSGGWISYTTANSGLTSGYVTAIDIDAYGRKWIGSDYDGVDVLGADGITWENYTPPTVSASTINDIAPAPDGDVWLATEGYDEGGATRAFRSSEAWQVYNTENSGLAYDTVSAVEVDADGNVWFASSDGWYGPPELNRLWADLETWEYHYLPEQMGGFDGVRDCQ
jgi:ligand-binding sensor domain-containing protein